MTHLMLAPGWAAMYAFSYGTRAVSIQAINGPDADADFADPFVDVDEFDELPPQPATARAQVSATDPIPRCRRSHPLMYDFMSLSLYFPRLTISASYFWPACARASCTNA